MSFTVVSQINSSGDRMTYEQRYRRHLETYLNVLSMANPKLIVVSANLVHQFEGNLFGYLASISESVENFWIILRMNGMHHPGEFGSRLVDKTLNDGTVTLKIPDQNLLNNIRTLYLSIKK